MWQFSAILLVLKGFCILFVTKKNESKRDKNLNGVKKL